MGRRPLPGHAARVQSGKPPAPPPAPAGVHTGRPRSQRAAPTNWLLDMIMIINGIGRGAPKRPPQSVNQVQVSGDGSVSIQSGGSITISASNGSVAAWSIDNLNALTLAPGNGPTDQPGRGQHRRPEVSWRASTRSLARFGFFLTFATGCLALSLTVLIVGGASWATYASLVLNPPWMAFNAYMIRAGFQERLAARNAYTPGCPCDRCNTQAWLDAERAYEDSKPPCPIGTWETREFTASCDCPNPRCGAIATHGLRQPGPDDPDLAEGVVIRTCTTCGQEWTER